MKYDVTFQLDGVERTERVDADDAATAASRARNTYTTDEATFELLLVHLIAEDEAETADAAVS